MSSRNSRFSRPRSFSIEQLEDRQLMAGDVAATLTGGNLFLNEAAGQAGADQKVAVSQLTNGKIRVAAAAGSATLINGAAFQDFTVTGDLNVNFGGGNDLVVFDQAAPPAVNNINLNVGVASAAPGTDDDNVILWSVKSRGSVFIDTGADDDWVFISGAKIGDGVGVDNLYVNMGAGADSVTLKNAPLLGDLGGSVDIQTYGLASELDVDTVWLENVIVKNDLNIRTGGGDDLVHIALSTVYDDVDVNTDAGADTVELDRLTFVDSLMTRLGEGADTLTMTNVYGTNGLAMGEGGSDRITRTGGNINSFSHTGFEWVNGRPTWWYDLGLVPVTRAGVASR